MAVDSPQTQGLPPLAELLAGGKPLRPAISLRIAVAIVNALRKLHAAGRFHGQIHPETIRFDAARGQLALLPPAAECELGGLGSDLDLCPPELHGAEPVTLSTRIDVAEASLAAAHRNISPRRIDLHQLTAVLVRMVTGQPLSRYLRSVKVKALAPPAVQRVIERGLAFQPDAQFASCDEFQEALRDAAKQLGIEMRLAPAPSTPAQASAVTPPPSLAPVVAAPAPTEAEMLPFARLGHYQILRRLGRGGMGDVYLGREEALDRSVAIKVLPSELAQNDDFVRRFQLEATAVAKLNHPNIVPIYFIGHESGKHFFAMQLVEGQSLDQLLASRGKLEPPETLAILRQCLAGLGVAHRAGLVHRDVKPANILLEAKSGRALVADFGLVKNGRYAGAGVTMTGVVVGTADYIAPEQAKGKDVDGRADLYSLGVMTYEMLSGKLPFRADSASAMIFQHAYEPAPPLDVPGIPKVLSAVVERLMAKEPEKRFQTCEEALAALKGSAAPASPKEARASRVVRASQIDIAPARALPPPLPVDLGSAPEGMFARLARRFRKNAPKALKQFQGTSQQMDDALAEYQERRDRIAALVLEARAVIGDLTSQAKKCRGTAAAAAKASQTAGSDEKRQKAVRDQAECETAAAELDMQAAEQQSELTELELRLTQANAELGRLRSQRDVLHARLRTAQAELAGPDGKNGGGSSGDWWGGSGSGQQKHMILAGAGTAAVLLLIVCIALFVRPADPNPVTVGPLPVTPIVSLPDKKQPPISPTKTITPPDNPVTTPLPPAATSAGDWQFVGPSVIFDPPFLDYKTPGGLAGEKQGMLRGLDATDTTAIASYEDKSVRGWDLIAGKPLFKKDPNWPNSQIKFVDKGKNFYYLGAGGTLTLADGKTGETIREFSKIKNVDHFDVTSDHKMAVTASKKLLQHWKLSDETQLVPASNTNVPIAGVRYSNDNTRLAYTTDQVNFCDVSRITMIDGKAPVFLTLGALKFPSFHYHINPDFTPDDTRYFMPAAGAGIGVGSLTDPNSITLSYKRYGIAHPPEKWPRNTISAAASPDGRWLVSGEMFRGTISFFDARTMTEKYTFMSCPIGASRPRVFHFIRALRFTPDGTRLVCGCDSGIQVLDFAELLRWEGKNDPRLANRSLVWQQPLPEPAMAMTLHGSAVYTANTIVHQFFYYNSYSSPFWDIRGDLSPGKAAIATNPVEKNKFVWSANGESVVHAAQPPPKRPTSWTLDPAPRRDFAYEGHQKAVRALAFTPSGNHVLSGGEDGTLRIWDPANPGGKDLVKVDGFKSPVVAIAVTNDDQFIAARSLDGITRIFKRFPFEKDGFFPTGEGPGNAVPIGPSAVLLAGNSEGMFLFDLSMKKGSKQPVNGGVASVAVSPDGTLILSGGMDGVVRLWDRSFRELCTFHGHTGRVNAVAFHDSGLYAFTAGEDAVLRMWAIPTHVKN